jgi:hypothetical protein
MPSIDTNERGKKKGKITSKERWKFFSHGLFLPKEKLKNCP